MTSWKCDMKERTKSQTDQERDKILLMKRKRNHLSVLLAIRVDWTHVRRSNFVLRSQLKLSGNSLFIIGGRVLPDSSSRRARWRRWQRQRQRRWWPSPRGGWTMLSSSLVFSGMKKTVNNIQTTQHAKSKLILKPIKISHSQERERLNIYSKKKAFLSLLSA